MKAEIKIGPKGKSSTVRRWIRRVFLVWALLFTLWFGSSFQTRGIPPGTWDSSATPAVVDGPATLNFVPLIAKRRPALLFICGGGVSAHAYAPLLRPIAEKGYAVFILKLPYRFAPLESHKQSALRDSFKVIAAHPEHSTWVLSGHSLGAALACRAVQEQPTAFAEMILIGTTHPKQDNLAHLTIPVTKIYGTNDGVANADNVLQNKLLLPPHTHWLEIAGGNHSQFGHYGHQLFDGNATLTRSKQQSITRSEMIRALNRVEADAN